MKNKPKKYNTLYIIGSLTVISFVVFCLLYFFLIQKEVITLRSDTETIEQSDDVFSEDLWRKQLELYLDFQKKESKQEKNTLPSEKQTNEIPQKDIHKLPEKEEINKNIEVKEAFLFSSLTSSTGSVSVSGKATGYNVKINGSTIEVQNGKFSSGASSTFSIVFENEMEKRVVHVSSPPYATNMAVQYLTIGIDPFTSYMTLHIKLNLKLPGTMTGELINLSSGAGSSISTQNGEFNLSVPLIEGNNAITARGSWLTISLDLPSINIKLSN
ncbi:MAG: hypothetical protein R6W78_00010 [Bacteroidales bacterium]